MADPKIALFESVAARIATMMESEDANWTRPWSVTGAPRNPLSGSRYTGFNNMQLTLTGWEKGWSDPRWATFKQVQAAGGQVRKGEKSTHILRFGTVKREGEGGKEETSRFLRVYHVFNLAEQVDGIELEPLAKEHEHTPLADLDRWLATREVPFKTEGDRACYAPATDEIRMPPLSRFEEVPAYYATFFHELIHATGHKKRLHRFDGGEAFGSASYAWEELIAELGAAMLCQHHGLTSEPRRDHAQYLNAWVKRLREKPKDLMSAAKEASAAASWLIDLDTRMQQEAA
jgi:antirestriction protein ArdC